MGDDKKEGEEKKEDNSKFKEILSSLVVAVAVAAIIGFVLYPLHIIRLDLATMFGSASWIILSLILGLIVGALYYLAPSKSKSTWAIVGFVIIIIVLAVMGLVQFGFLQGPADSVGNFFKSTFGNIGNSYACLLDSTSEKCRASMGDNTDNTDQDSSDTATVTFSNNGIKDGQVNTNVKISYDNKEPTSTRVTPRCFAGEKEEDMQEISIQSMNPPKDGEDFLFPANVKTSTSLKCAGSVPECKTVTTCNRNVFFTLTRDMKIIGDSWEVDLNHASVPTSHVNELNPPYYAEINYDGSSVLLTPGTTIYFQVKIIGTETKEKLKKINYVTLKFPEEISIECNQGQFSSIPGGIELRNVDPLWLEQNNFKTGENEYSFDCSLTVETETTSIQKIVVTLNSGYNVESLFGPYLLKEQEKTV
jgi:hypothetical protein